MTNTLTVLRLDEKKVRLIGSHVLGLELIPVPLKQYLPHKYTQHEMGEECTTLVTEVRNAYFELLSRHSTGMKYFNCLILWSLLSLCDLYQNKIRSGLTVTSLKISTTWQKISPSQQLSHPLAHNARFIYYCDRLLCWDLHIYRNFLGAVGNNTK